MMNGMLTPCGCCKNRRFGGTYRLHYHGDDNRRARSNVSSNYHIVFFAACLDCYVLLTFLALRFLPP
jgi:hypothetical protein